MSDLQNQVADNSRRIGELEVEMGRVSLSLAHNEERAKERHEQLSTQQIQMVDMLEERDREAREYRQKREQAEAEASLANRRWLMSLINPQTVWIILSILLALVGLKSFELDQVLEATSATSP